MSDVTIDVDILMFGCSAGPDHSRPCLLLMTEIARPDSERKVVFDKGGLIATEYDRKLRHDEFGQAWFRYVSQNRCHLVDRKSINKAVTRKLLDHHFDTKDLNRYVRPAAASDDKLLVTHDPGYSVPIRKELKSSLSIAVHSAFSVHCEICGCSIDDCLAKLTEMEGPPPST